MNQEIIISVLKAVFWLLLLLTLILVTQKITLNFAKWNKQRLKLKVRNIKEEVFIKKISKHSYFVRTSLLFAFKVTYVLLLNQFFKIIK